MSWRNIKLSEVIIHRKGFITIDNSVEYMRCRVQVNKKGVILRDTIKGLLINTKKQQVCKAGDFHPQTYLIKESGHYQKK